MRMAFTSAELMRGFWRIDCGMGARHVGQDVLLCCTHLVKQPRQKLCWQGACTASGGFSSPARGGKASRGAHRHRALAQVEAEGTLERVVDHGQRALRPGGALACKRPKTLSAAAGAACGRLGERAEGSPRVHGCSFTTHPWCRLLQQLSLPRALRPWAQSWQT